MSEVSSVRETRADDRGQGFFEQVEVMFAFGVSRVSSFSSTFKVCSESEILLIFLSIYSRIRFFNRYEH